MSLMTLLQQAQAGQLFAHVARTLDLDEAETRNAMAKICPAIAVALKEKAEKDEDLFQSLIDLIEDDGDDSPLDDPDGITDADAISDGNAILDDIYGSRNDAMVALRRAAPNVPERELSKLAPISATAVVAALAEANRPMAAAAPLPAAQDGGGGILGTIIGAVISGAVSGAMREIKTKSRSRRRYSTSRSRRKAASPRRRSSSSRRKPSSKALEDIFGNILGNILK